MRPEKTFQIRKYLQSLIFSKRLVQVCDYCAFVLCGALWCFESSHLHAHCQVVSLTILAEFQTIFI